MADHSFILIFAFCSYLCYLLPLSVGLELTTGSLLLFVFVFSCLSVGLELTTGSLLFEFVFSTFDLNTFERECVNI